MIQVTSITWVHTRSETGEGSRREFTLPRNRDENEYYPGNSFNEYERIGTKRVDTSPWFGRTTAQHSWATLLQPSLKSGRKFYTVHELLRNENNWKINYFVFQIFVSLFTEDTRQLPNDLFTERSFQPKNYHTKRRINPIFSVNESHSSDWTHGSVIEIRYY